jgi:hypothetical protein
MAQVTETAEQTNARLAMEKTLQMQRQSHDGHYRTEMMLATYRPQVSR